MSTERPDGAARHVEIKRRYQRHARERFGSYDRGRHRAAEVSKLAKHRRQSGNGFDPKPIIDDIFANARIWTARDWGIGSGLHGPSVAS